MRAYVGLSIVVLVMLFVARASAFCGFYVAPEDKPLYNDASTVALMRQGTMTVMSMSNNYRGPAKDFAMVVPVPVVLKKEAVKTLDRAIFAKLETLTAPRLVEYWEEDPCAHPCANAEPNSCGWGYGSGGSAMGGSGKGGSYGVKVEAKFAVGEYDIVILGASESDGLEKWLVAHGYKIPAGASAALAPYVKEQSKFFVAKIDISKVKMDAQGVAVLSPLRLQYESSDFRLPVRLGLLNAKAKQDLIVYVLSPTKRYDVANYPNLFIPTNLEVKDDVRKSFSAFYAALFDEAVAKAGGRGVVTEYAWTSGSCDPCPTPPLESVDVLTLGGDAIGSNGQSMVLTRLHARYDATALTDDLVFRAAAPVTGGREWPTDESGALSTIATTSSSDSFQARYIIRHAWVGAVKCKNPIRGTWGGPPPGAKSTAAGATGLAAAPRGVIKLAALLKAGLPKFPLVLDPLPAAATAIEVDAGVSDASVDDASFPAPPSPSSSPSVDPLPPAAKRGCGCATAGSRAELASTSIALLAIALLVARRTSRA